MGGMQEEAVVLTTNHDHSGCRETTCRTNNKRWTVRQLFHWLLRAVFLHKGSVKGEPANSLDDWFRTIPSLLATMMFHSGALLTPILLLYFLYTTRHGHSNNLPTRSNTFHGRQTVRTWKLGEQPGAGSRVMTIIDLTAATLETSRFWLPTGAKKPREALSVQPAVCGVPTQCPDFTSCTSGASTGGNGTGLTTGGISICVNSWLTDDGSMQTAHDAKGFHCPIFMERKETVRVRDQPGGCEETKDAFGEAAGKEHTAPSWRGGVAVLEDVYVNHHGHVFNATHHFYSGACTPLEGRRRPPMPFAKVRADTMQLHAVLCEPE